MTFDSNGNLTTITDSSGTTGFTWDARDRLVAVEAPGTLATFTYAFGRRIAKAVNGIPTQFIYDGLDIAQQIAPQGTTTAYLRSPAIDQMLGLMSGDGSFFAIADPLGSTLAITDVAGNALPEYTYEPFGATTATNPGVANPFQFTGRANEELFGLYYYRARYYQPGLARFVSEDPIGLRGGLNAYRYATNNPLTFSDPLGLKVDINQLTPELRDALERVKQTRRGRILYEALERSPNTYTFRPWRAAIDGPDHPAFFDPKTFEIVIDPDLSHYRPVQTSQGPMPQNLERIIGHEMGHAATRAPDPPQTPNIPGITREPGANVILNENPIAVELGQLPRIVY